MMQTARDTVQDWLDQRSERERTLLALAVAAFLLWLGVAAVWQPLLRHKADLETKRHFYATGLVTLEATAVFPGNQPAAESDSRPVPVILTDSAAVFQVVIRRLEADGNGARIVLEEATFEQVILWLEALQRDHGLRVRDLEMTRRPAPGMVSVSLALER